MNTSLMPGRVSESPVALVIGAYGSVGDSTARVLCGEGYTVIGTCLSIAQARMLLARGVCHHAVCMALDKPKSINNAFADIKKAGVKRLDVLVSCAGALHADPAWGDDDKIEHHFFEADLEGALRVVHQALPALLSAHGRIVFIGSSSDGVGIPVKGAHLSSRIVSDDEVDALRRELKGERITVSQVFPREITTSLTPQRPAAGKVRVNKHNGSAAVMAKPYRHRPPLIKLVDRSAQTPLQVSAVVLKALKATQPKPRYFTSLDQVLLRSAVNLIPDSIMSRWMSAMEDTITATSPR